MESDVRGRLAAPPVVVCLNLQRFATGDPGKPLGSDGSKRRSATRGKTQKSTVTTLPRPRAGRSRPSAKAANSGTTGGAGAKTTAPARRVPPCVDPEVASRTAKYIVQPGDTLHKLGRQFNSTPQALAMLNNLHKPTILFPGDVLLVPDHKG